MIIEFHWNTLDDNEWWFDLGIGYQNTDYYEYRKVFTIGLGIATIYFRWKKAK
jgi:hypothetical protein